MQSVLSDFTPEKLLRVMADNPRGVIIHADELLGTFNSANRYNHGQFVEQVLSAHSGSPLKVSRVGDDEPVVVIKPNLTLLGSIQTAMVPELWKKKFINNGLIDRFDFIYPKVMEIPLWRDNYDTLEVQRDCTGEWNEVLIRILGFPEKSIRWTREAYLRYYHWHNSRVMETNEAYKTGAVDQPTRPQKQDLKVARYAMVVQALKLAMGETETDDVELSSIDAALAIVDYFEDCYNRIVADLGRMAMDSDTMDFLDCMGKKFTAKEAIVAGELVEWSERKTFNMIDKLITLKIIKRVNKGNYERL